MKHVLSRYRTYTKHQAALSEDPLVEAAKRTKILGYHWIWTHAKYILGLATYVDILSPSAILSIVVKHDQLDTLAALTGLLRSVKEVEKLLQCWTTYAIAALK